MFVVGKRTPQRLSPWLPALIAASIAAGVTLTWKALA
jgi:hypothetical protein